MKSGNVLVHLGNIQRLVKCIKIIIQKLTQILFHHNKFHYLSTKTIRCWGSSQQQTQIPTISSKRRISVWNAKQCGMPQQSLVINSTQSNIPTTTRSHLLDFILKTYFFKNNINQYVKIGKSIAPHSRALSVAGECTFVKISVFHIIEGDFERFFQRLYSSNRVCGEWYNIPDVTKEEIESHLVKNTENDVTCIK